MFTGMKPALLFCASENASITRVKNSIRNRAGMVRRRREQQRRHRCRLAAGRRAYLVELDGRVIDWLIRTEWLTDAEAGDDGAVGRAVEALLIASAT
jgi:hypothetical protein